MVIANPPAWEVRMTGLLRTSLKVDGNPHMEPDADTWQYLATTEFVQHPRCHGASGDQPVASDAHMPHENPNSFIFMQMNMSLTSKGLKHIISNYKNAHFPYRADDTWMASQAENVRRNAMLDADLEE